MPIAGLGGGRRIVAERSNLFVHRKPLYLLDSSLRIWTLGPREMPRSPQFIAAERFGASVAEAGFRYGTWGTE